MYTIARQCWPNDARPMPGIVEGLVVNRNGLTIEFITDDGEESDSFLEDGAGGRMPSA